MFEAFGWLNGFLEENDYIAGSTVTVADLFAVSSMLSIVVSCAFVEMHMQNQTFFTCTQHSFY